MGTQIFLGKPPASIEQWIRDHHGSSGHADTWYKYANDTEWRTVSIQGAIVGGDDKTPTTQIPNVGSVVELEIGSDVTSIGQGAFAGRSGLTSVTIGNNVTSIGAGAFIYCYGLTSVTFADGVTSIGNSAFWSCYNLTSVTIPDSVTSIGESAFYGCSGLTSVIFSGKDKATVQGMSNHYWGLPSGCVLHCTDGDIII